MYTKTNPNISFSDFIGLVRQTKNFTSVTGKEYEVSSIDAYVMAFIRKSTGERWRMDLRGVHQAYLELTDFKTVSFKPYVPRTHSPALGLLIHTGLLS